MKVFLDSIVFHDNLRAMGDSFQLLADAVAEGGIEVFVPEVVIQEAVKQFRNRIEKAERSITSASHELKTLLDEFDPIELPDIDSEVDQFETKLRNRIEEDFGFNILPLPAVSLQHLLDRDKANRKPFADGRGFRDTLIWESILTILCSGPSDFVIISGNSKDFGSKEMKELHSDLRLDLGGLPAPPPGKIGTHPQIIRRRGCKAKAQVC